MNDAPNQALAKVHMDEMLYMRERVFWQSRALLRDPPRLVDLPDLATAIKRTWGTQCT